MVQRTFKRGELMISFFTESHNSRKYIEIIVSNHRLHIEAQMLVYCQYYWVEYNSITIQHTSVC